ncbi:TetR family transcriptional regulator [Stackebrandtia albiflava]|uniref:TetR family transcriptional regulator n=1 Tax=Stackebrandtia albiflava TaxID=406432 RepID=A0A562VGW8_9ACTN|nr:TetR/AcrR family transcriptional regulator C-terminal domain-containing protein [Stackebrandtia albiflava]TWJ17091.1 TetR family transcriptional regulator [Stackebrandtia albiflava]
MTETEFDPVAARRTITLLWRKHLVEAVKPGPKARISVDDLVAKAILRADREGLPAVTIRGVAADVGVRPMTVYSHVPDRETLVALMVDASLAQMPAPASGGLGVEAALTALVDDNHHWYVAHPWLADAHTERPPMGPGVIGKYERELAVVARLGLSDLDTDAALSFLLNFARAAAADTVRSRADAVDGGRWWEAVGPVLSEVLDPVDYPLSGRIGTAAGSAMSGAYNARHAYEFGRERTVTAIIALSESGRAGR